MKKLFLLLFPLLVSCQIEQITTLNGKVELPKGAQLQTFALQGSDTLMNVTTDEAGNFSLKFDTRKVPFFTMTGKVLMENKDKWQFSTPIYLESNGTTQIELKLTNYTPKVISKDASNQAIQACNDYFCTSRQASYSYTPKSENLQAAVNKHLEKVEEIKKKYNTNKEVSEYLTTWSQLEYMNMVNNAKKTYKRTGQELPENIYNGIPGLDKVMDKPYWMMYESASFIIGDFIEANTKTPEEQVAFLKEHFTVPSLLQDQIRRIVSVFVFTYPYSTENLERLKKISEGMDGRDYIVKTYHERRFSVAGAEIPDLEFEDLSGKKHKLTEFKGKYIYLDLWASWCGPCKKEIPYLKKLKKELKNKNVVIVSISCDKDRKAWEDKLKEEGLRENQWLGMDNAIGRMLNIPGIPYFLIYDKEGKLMEYRAPRPSHRQTKAMLEALK